LWPTPAVRRSAALSQVPEENRTFVAQGLPVPWRAYGLVFYAWGFRRELPVGEFKHYSALKDRMLQRPAVRRVVEEEMLAIARDLVQ
jgi:hypothetical protein